MTERIDFSGRLLCAIAVFFALGTCGAATAAPDRVRPESHVLVHGDLSRGRPGEIGLEIDLEAYRSLRDAGQGAVARFPLPDGRQVDLQLSAFEVIAPGATFVRVGPDGERIAPRPDIRFLRGTVAGESGSLVVMSLFQNRIAGFVRLGDEEFGFGPQAMSLSRPGATDLRVWNRDLEVGEAVCQGGVDVADPSNPSAVAPWETFAAGGGSTRDHLGGAQLLIELAIDSTTEWCAHFGDDAVAAEAYVLNSVAQISAIYDAEVAELVQVPFLRTHCGAADPYTDGLTALGDRSTLLTELKDHWSANMSAVARTVTHLFTWSDTSSAGGLAYTYFGSNAVLCNQSFGYGVDMVPAQNTGSPASFEVRVEAHELGHNHSSPHTNCLQDGGGQWLSTCSVESCNGNPHCDPGPGCYPGPQDTNMTGTLMSTGCNNRIPEFDDNIVESILRGAAEAASCVGAAGLPGDVREDTGDGVRVSKVASCPAQDLQNDDGSKDITFGGGGGCPNCLVAWIKRFTPGCYPFQLNRVDGLTYNVSAGRPIRVLVYADPAGTGDPADSNLVYTEDVIVQNGTGSAFNQYTLASPVVVNSGDLYIGLYDLVQESPAPFIAGIDTSTTGDSYYAINTTSPTSYTLRNADTFMLRGQGGPVPAGSLVLDWGLPCNDTAVPGQDFAVYRGDLDTPGVYTNLTCSTVQTPSYFAESPADGFFVVVPHTTPSEGSYGQTSAGAERPGAAAPCKSQDAAACP